MKYASTLLTKGYWHPFNEQLLWIITQGITSIHTNNIHNNNDISKVYPKLWAIVSMNTVICSIIFCREIFEQVILRASVKCFKLHVYCSINRNLKIAYPLVSITLTYLNWKSFYFFFWGYSPEVDEIRKEIQANENSAIKLCDEIM